MDAKGEFEGSSRRYVQQTFFLKELSSRPNGYYRYRKTSLKAPMGSVVLFQYDGYIIASAILMGVETFQREEAGGYRGAMHFDVKSIKVFDPVSSSTIARIWPEFKAFGRAKQSLSPDCYPTFVQKLSDVEIPKFSSTLNEKT